MKLFFYINSIHEGGGAERVISVLSQQMAKRGCDVTMITSFKDTWEYTLDEKVRRISLESEKLKTNKLKRNLSRIRKLRSICKREKPDVLISFMFEPNIRALIATMGLKTKTIISVRNDPEKENGRGVARFLAKTLYRLADGYVFQTEQAKKWFAPKIQKKSVVILNPVSDSFYYVNGAPCVKKSVVSVGRLEEDKNFNLLIKAFALIADEYPEYQLEIYGDGTLRNMLKELINELDLSNRIILKGQCSDISSQIKDASLFVLSSNVEGLPNALMEAMALGLPVISTDFAGGGARTLIEDGVNGIIVPIGNEKALAEAMRKILSDREYALNLGSKAKVKSSEFKPDNIADKWYTYIKYVAARIDENMQKQFRV